MQLMTFFDYYDIHIFFQINSMSVQTMAGIFISWLYFRILLLSSDIKIYQ